MRSIFENSIRKIQAALAARNRNTGSAAPHIIVGTEGEDAAVKFMRSRGFRVIDRNFRVKYGEIDIICRQKKMIVFVEVKTRSSNSFGDPFEAVNRHKQRRIAMAAITYLRRKNWEDFLARFDVLAITRQNGRTHIEHVPDAFDLPMDLR